MNERHGDTKSRLHNIWGKMKQRCSNPNDKYYCYYGGKGIRVCDEWNNSYVAFKEWAMNNGYADNLTIDRINPEDGYRPANCRWITKSENSRHALECIRKRENLKYVEIEDRVFHGRTLTEIMAIRNAEEDAKEEKEKEHRRKQRMYEELFCDRFG